MSTNTMACLVGAVLAIATVALARFAGLDRDRALYPVMLIVVPSYYALFAVIGGSMAVLAAEIAPIAVFVALAIMGFRYGLWLVAAGLAAHGLFDAVHGHLIANPGMPPWWPFFCGTFDVVAGAVVAAALFLTHRKMEASCANR